MVVFKDALRMFAIPSTKSQYTALRNKVQEIKSSPYKLRRTLQSYPYYATLDKCLTVLYSEELSEEEKQSIKQFVEENIVRHK